jgi:O-succinylbenzoic acid--CoA ligase
MQVEAWLARAARTAPGAIAVETAQARLSYAELWDAASSGAAELAARGARRGERVAIALPAGIDFAVALHACMLLGAVAVPVDLRLTRAERERTTAGAGLVVSEPLAAAEGRSARLAAQPPRSPTRSRVTTVAKKQATVGATHDLTDVCAVIHTSGTTSAPRPVELTYGNFLWSALGSGVALGVDPDERWLCALPLAHVGGLSILLRSAIFTATVVIQERFETESALVALREQQITLVSLVATTLARLLDAGLREPPALRWALTGGGPIPEALVERAQAAGVPVAPTYGLTEACSQVSTNGPPLFCTRVRIDPGSGEILVAGPTVAPASPAADGWLHTGDLGRLDADGYLSVSGRAAETIVSGGENVAPSEVEAALESHPDVLEAAVVGREDELWGEAVSAIVVLRPGPAAPGRGLPATSPAGVVEAELRAHCARRLAPFKVPKSIALRTTPLPRTRSGKLLRREL